MKKLQIYIVRLACILKSSGFQSLSAVIEHANPACLGAAGRFKGIRQRLGMDGRVNKNSNYKEKKMLKKYIKKYLPTGRPDESLKSGTHCRKKREGHKGTDINCRRAYVELVKKNDNRRIDIDEGPMPLWTAIRCWLRMKRSGIVRLYHELISGHIFFICILMIGEFLQRKNETAKKFLADTRDRTKTDQLIAELQYKDSFNSNYFNEVYQICVEKKRQKILADIRKIDGRYREYYGELRDARLVNEAMSAEMNKKQVLETYYAFLKDDNVFHQKAFTEFLKKTMEKRAENGDDCRSIGDYLEDHYRNISSEEYFFSIFDQPVFIGLPELWTEFLKSGSEYTDVIPDERPGVYYFSSAKNIPCFIFKKPYVDKYSREEFCREFIAEWGVTHDCSRYGSEQYPIWDEIYNYYICAHARFR